jgi:hypothetical protein
MAAKTSSVGAAVLAAIALAAPVQAQELTFEQAVQRLFRPDRAEVEIAIQTFGLLGTPRAVAPLSERIRDGLPPDLLEQAVDTLMVLGSPEAGPVLFELVTHRRPGIRLRAVQAIAACRPRGADRALVTALSDADPQVRSAAAVALGELRAESAIDSLWLAFDRGVPEAGSAVAHVARAEHVPRVLGYIGRVPFAQVRSMLATLLGRPEIPQRVKVDIIARVGELATAEARAFLLEVGTSLPANDPVRRAAEDTANRIVP